jgi:cation diffusion facilitator CzcD-associated flavoprotein CzcO
VCPLADLPLSYSPGPEIFRYFQGIAEKYELYRYIKLSHKVIGATWNEFEGIWALKVEDMSTGTVFDDWCHFLISGSGILKYVLAEAWDDKSY